MDRFSNNNLRKSHRSARASSSSMDSSVSSSYSSNNSNLNHPTSRKSFPNQHYHHRQQSNDINASFSSSSVAGSIQVCFFILK